jgi:hypothetical protein
MKFLRPKNVQSGVPIKKNEKKSGVLKKNVAQYIQS